jgi:hypothetical protein
MKVYGEWKCSSTILDLGTRWRRVVSFTLRPLYIQWKSPTVHIGYDFVWAPTLVCTLWCLEKFLAPAGNRTPVVQTVARRYTDYAIVIYFKVPPRYFLWRAEGNDGNFNQDSRYIGRDSNLTYPEYVSEALLSEPNCWTLSLWYCATTTAYWIHIIIEDLPL